jgi:hypothetical protein
MHVWRPKVVLLPAEDVGTNEIRWRGWTATLRLSKAFLPRRFYHASPARIERVGSANGSSKRIACRPLDPGRRRPRWRGGVQHALRSTRECGVGFEQGPHGLADVSRVVKWRPSRPISSSTTACLTATWSKPVLLAPALAVIRRWGLTLIGALPRWKYQFYGGQGAAPIHPHLFWPSMA